MENRTIIDLKLYDELTGYRDVVDGKKGVIIERGNFSRNITFVPESKLVQELSSELNRLYEKVDNYDGLIRMNNQLERDLSYYKAQVEEFKEDANKPIDTNNITNENEISADYNKQLLLSFSKMSAWGFLGWRRRYRKSIGK